MVLHIPFRFLELKAAMQCVYEISIVYRLNKITILILVYKIWSLKHIFYQNIIHISHN